MPASSARRRCVAVSTTARPAAVTDTCTARRSARARCRRIRPLRSSRSHIRPAVDGVTSSADARSVIRCGPREASTTSARYWAIVVSSAAAPSDCVDTATSVRLAVSTASTTASSTAYSVTSNPSNLIAQYNSSTMLLTATAPKLLAAVAAVAAVALASTAVAAFIQARGPMRPG
jgi:hypothetical protein